MAKVFLGGTCNNSRWRDILIPMLKIDYFNPVVDDWTPECQKREIEEREKADFVLYVITKEMTGVYSIAEVVDDSNKRPEKTIFCVLKEGFNEGQLRSLDAVTQMVRRNGAKVFDSLEEIADYLNTAHQGGFSLPQTCCGLQLHGDYKNSRRALNGTIGRRA